MGNLDSHSVLSPTKQRYKDLEARTMLYKMHAPLVLVVLIGLFACTAYGGAARAGCTGKLTFEPQLRRGSVSRLNKYWTWIRANMNGNRIRTTSITVQGTCCWEIHSRDGEKQELFPGRGQKITPSIAYILKFKTKECTSE